MTDVIVRQTNDLRRIVDEFSQVRPDARTRPARRRIWRKLLRDAVLLQEGALPGITLIVRPAERAGGGSNSTRR